MLRPLRTGTPRANAATQTAPAVVLILSRARRRPTSVVFAAATPPPAREASPAPAPSSPPPLTPEPLTPPDLLVEFERKLEADLRSVGATIVAVSGVIVYWRGVWSLLDHVLGDSVFGDVACVVLGLLTVLGVRLSGAKLSSFWPSS
jgi:hypothetical protein